MSDNNIMRRIANNHQIKFIIEPLSYDTIGGIQIRLAKENEDGSKSYISRTISRYNYDALANPDKMFILIFIDMLDEAEKEDK